MPDIIRKSFFGLDVSLFTEDQLIEYLYDSIKNNESRIFYGHSFWTIPSMIKHKEIYTYGNEADILGIDGRWYYLLLKLFGLGQINDISIPQMVYIALNEANNRKYSLIVWGATEEINILAASNIRKNYPGIVLLDSYSGYFNDSEKNKILHRIKKLNPDILLIGITSPIKEILSSEIKLDKAAKIIIPCGGMIDVLSGKTKVTPAIFKKLGLASIYRIIQEPRRILKRNLYVYYFTIFNFLPRLFFNVCILRNKNYSIPKDYNIIK